MDLPDTLTSQDLEEIADHLSIDDLQTLRRHLEAERRSNLYESIESQVPEPTEVIGDMTSQGYFEQNLEIDPHNQVKFRSISREFQDRIYDEAPPGDPNEPIDQTKQRKRNLLKLSYMLLEHNGNIVGKSPVQGSIFEKLRQVGDECFDAIQERADSRLRHIQALPDAIVRKLSEARDLWEGVVFDRIQHAHMNPDETAGNS